jgi:hypothetical protein
MQAGDLLFETLVLRPRMTVAQLGKAWSACSPDGLYSLVEFERAAMWVMRRLVETKSDAAAPKGFIDPLRKKVANYAARNMLVDAEAEAILDFLADEGIRCVLLKGIARRAAGAAYPCGDARATNDVDLLLPAKDVRHAWEGLRAMGYERYSNAVSPHHAPPLLGKNRVSVELHHAMSHTMKPAEAWRRANDGAREVTWYGRRVIIPAPTELLWHGMSHALQHGTLAWRLRFFLDGASILAGHEPVKWEIINHRLDTGEISGEDQARRWIDAAAQLANADVPASITRGANRFDVMRFINWRLIVLRRQGVDRFGGRLLEEATRRELGIGVAPSEGSQTVYKRARRRVGGWAARAVYAAWRATARTEPFGTTSRTSGEIASR